MKIKTRLLVIFISVATTCVATLTGMLYAEHRIETALESTNKAYGIVDGVSSLVGLATEINKAGLDRVQRQWKVKLKSLNSAILEYQSAPEATEKMARDLTRADATFRELVLMMEREIQEGLAMNFMRARLSRYNHLTVLLNNLSTTAKLLADKNYVHVQKVQKSRDFIFALLGTLLCSLMGAWLWVLWKGIRSPLRHLASSIFKVGSGDLDHRVEMSSNNTDNELSRLMTAYNSMLDRLQKLTVSRQHLLDATEAERARIGRELHDGISQTLVGVRLKIELLPSTEKERQEQLNAIADHLSDAQREIQRIVKDLRPAMLDDLGLVETLHWFREEYSNGRTITFDTAVKETDIPPDLRTPIFRIVQEGTNNAYRHGDAHNIYIQLDIHDNNLILFIEDDGCGFTTSTKSTGNGLVNIRERVAAANGELSIDSSPGRGCSIIVSFPLAS